MPSSFFARLFVSTISLSWLIIGMVPSSAFGLMLQWSRQTGTASYDGSSGVSADDLGNVYISGETRGSLADANVGDVDLFVSKYDRSGNLLWNRQLGTSSSDFNFGGISTDGEGIYIAGGTTGNLGGPNAGIGSQDAFIAKYDPAGNLKWIRQFGTSSGDSSGGVSVDGLGNVYLTGYTNGHLGGLNVGAADTFVTKLDSDGNFQWTKLHGSTANDFSHGIAADGLGNIYVTGHTEGSISAPNAGGTDVFLMSLDSDGRMKWSRQFGSNGYDQGNSVAADGLGSVYISGSTDAILGGLNMGRTDAFLSKFDFDGQAQWLRQLGTGDDDNGSGVAVDRLGNVFLSGGTRGSLGGANAGEVDAYVAWYDPAGNVRRTWQIGTSSEDYSSDVSADNFGNIYISGGTDGSLAGDNAGGVDALLVKYIVGPTGDFNNDFAVDAADYVIWRKHLGQLAERCNGADADCDGFVTVGDYQQWRRNYGRISILTADGSNLVSGVAVPEPFSLTLFVVALLGPLGLMRGR